MFIVVMLRVKLEGDIEEFHLNIIRCSMSNKELVRREIQRRRSYGKYNRNYATHCGWCLSLEFFFYIREFHRLKSSIIVTVRLVKSNRFCSRCF